MKDFILETVLKPTIKALADLCEVNGITFICLVEYKDGLTTDILTSHIEDDASDEAKKALEAMKGMK